MIKESVVTSLKHVVGRHALLLGVVGLAGLGVFAVPVSAQPLSGPFAVFDQCPRFIEGVNFCSFAQIESGGSRIGNGGLLVVNPITLQGGYERNEEKALVTERFVGALDGETLSRTPQPIPGGLSGLINCEEITGKGFLDRAFRRVCKAILGNPALTDLNATTELAGPAEKIGYSSDNLVNEEGIALSLPVKIHLESSLLGKGCYIGSDRDPIVLNLTDGTTSPPPPNTPISGKLGNLNQFEFESYPYIEITGTTLVDNSFAVPGVTGCGGIFSSLIDPILDAKLGLPAPAGYNTILYNISAKVATAEDVVKLEKGQTTGPAEENNQEENEGGQPHEKWDHGHGNENGNHAHWWH
jgi:hypothetical protein